MKNNKGFTLIEVAVSFTLVATISIVLLQLVLSLKEVYLSGDVKTTLLNKQGIMTKYIYDDLNNKELVSITTCGLSCLTFRYGEGTVKNLLVDPGNKTIKYGDYTLQIDNSSYFGNLSVEYDETSSALTTGDDSVISINIPVISKLLDNENFGFNIIKTYNRSNTSINISSDIASTPVTLSGINTNISIIDEDSTHVRGIFVKLFRQTKDNYFGSDYNNFIKNNNANTFSTLTSLHTFKMTLNHESIINDITSNASLSAKEKREISQSYQDGYYSLLLNYNDAALSSGNYYWWYQTNNIASKETLKGFYVGFENGQAPNGLTYNKTGNNWSNIVGQATNIGVKNGSINDFNGNAANSVDLYAEAREYICKYSLSNVTYNGTNIKNLTLANGEKMCK
ncbi:MAG: prepilin-type N-terminal cleavage/methylation domain-containing protein [Bacilli bacterium]|nr:prepilin-type N-terminal cleavage/methylation domain-containing protein [Bacilli bacterium]